MNLRPWSFLVIALAAGCSAPSRPSEPGREDILGPRPVGDDPSVRPDRRLPGESIREAVAAAAAGDTVWIEPGWYRVTSEIVLDRSIRLLGRPGAVLELDEGVSTSIIGAYGSPEDPLSEIHIEGLVLRGAGEGQRVGSGVTLINVDGCLLKDLTASGCRQDEVYLSGVSRGLFENLTLSRNGRHGLAFGEASPRPNAHNAIRNCLAQGNSLHGFDGEPVAHTLFSSCSALDNIRDGFNLGAEARSSGNRILDCRALHNGRNGFSVWAPEQHLEACASRRNAGTGIAVIGPRAENVRIVGCVVVANGRHGISLDRAARATVHGNEVRDSGLAGLGDGIAAVSSLIVRGTRITGNTCSGRTHRFALVVGSGLRETVVAGNRLQGRVSIDPAALAR